jgi:hypothetical protein
MEVVNALAYYNTATIMTVKGFIVQAAGIVFTTLHFPRQLQVSVL